MNDSAMPSASGTRARPQKNVNAIAEATTPRITWTRIAARGGQPLRVASHTGPISASADQAAQQQRAVGADRDRGAFHQRVHQREQPDRRERRRIRQQRMVAGHGLALGYRALRAIHAERADSADSQPRGLIAGLETGRIRRHIARRMAPDGTGQDETMKISLRISLLAGLAAALTLPVAAQDVEPQPVLEEDAVAGRPRRSTRGADAAARAALPLGHAVAGRRMRGSC